jgi:putative oxidoreductase
MGGLGALPGHIAVAGVIELVGGALVMVGLATGWAAFLCSGQMAVAYFLAHQKEGLLPIQNKGELAALYSFVFLFLAVRGSGIWSVDAARGAAGGR